MSLEEDEAGHQEKAEEGEFGELLKYTIPGYVGGLFLGASLDYLGFQRSPIGQWLVRTLSGEGESVFEGIYAIRQRLSRASSSMAEAYGWGKFLGMTAPWIIDWSSRFLGVNVSGVGGFYIPCGESLLGSSISWAVNGKVSKECWI